jgi:hypothetical protein
MSWRDFAVQNSRLKLTALLLALLTWCAIKFAIYKGVAGRNQVLHQRAVMVLKAPDDGRVMRVEPPFVSIVVQANKELHDDDIDIEVFVDITQVPADVDSVYKPVVVRGPESEIEKVMAIKPASVVRVVRVPPVDIPSTNVLRKQP